MPVFPDDELMHPPPTVLLRQSTFKRQSCISDSS